MTYFDYLFYRAVCILEVKEVIDMKQVLVIGSTAVDVILKIPHLPKEKEDIHILEQHMAIGGCAYNVANILHHFQVEHTLFSPIGQGLYGDTIYEHFQQHNIPMLIPRVISNNGCCYCLVDDCGERTFLSHHGAEYRFKKEWFSTLDDGQYDTVYICGLEIEESTGNEIISYLEEYPHPTVFFAPGPRITHIVNERMERIFDLSPIVHLNLQEALQYTQTHTKEEAAIQLAKRTHNTVIITLQEEGCYLYHNQEGCTIPSTKINAVDTIGAGDAHVGTIIAGIKRGMHIKDACVLANKIAAGVVSTKGATLTKQEFKNIIHF